MFFLLELSSDLNFNAKRYAQSQKTEIRFGELGGVFVPSKLQRPLRTVYTPLAHQRCRSGGRAGFVVDSDSALTARSVFE